MTSWGDVVRAATTVQAENNLSLRKGAPATEKATRLPPSSSAVVTLRLHEYRELIDVYWTLKDGKSIIVDLNLVDENLARRAIDFAAGVSIALSGYITRLSSKMFLIVPSTTQSSELDSHDELLARLQAMMKTSDSIVNDASTSEQPKTSASSAEPRVP